MVVRAKNIMFDPQVHITAGQLRRIGVYLSELIPNEAFVRRVAVGIKPDNNIKDDDKALHINVLEPFVELAA